ncbi:hypothetical protein AAZX31_01G032000 [Glycine max]|uniref:ADP-ribosyl cyclase/cyclic ADP-ribose hydrolase n=2 Tax=Glycine soja TaxID=3848 RepID=A0A445LY94_GLYSO|nr:hypothetical protein GLYMA_01G033300v4 [Glycine max]RZC28280.1 Disease resistance protein TAO1 isoform A [Glycine soja]RZC28281.1 Disease resistance protein TAO1 isoform B [Glycine soja]
MAGSSSSAAVSLLPVIRHDVFLNFRGEDTRDNFISHIYAELQRNKIETYIDYRLARGEEISPALHKAIEESMIYVVVFSQNYASSTWCLDELTKILNCKKRYGRVVIPVFYKVDPSIVRHQRETYAEEFVKYKHRFADNIDKVHAWKAALTEAAEIAGWDSQKTSPEATLVAEIVKDILTKLNSSSSCDHQEFVGIETHITQIKLLMKLETLDIRIIGIWGLGGIGKTTIAGQIYHQLASQFCSSSLVLNVPEEIERHGIQRTRSNYEKELVEGGISISSERLKRTKVLLFLDDVNDSGQLRDLIGGRGRFGQGSRIILTSRDMQVLKNAEADEIYEVKEMNDEESLKLFSIHAFHQNQPIETYKELSEKVLRYAKGIPLALQILGSLLYRKTEEVWKNQLQKLEKYPDSKIFNVLKLSYDGLDEEQKNIFLDIACFYRGYWEIFVAQQLESCGFSATIGMDVLKDKCLISILKGNVQMHDLIQEMGREIVRQECCLNPGKRSRLWKVEEIHQVLKNNEGTDAVQCILLDTYKINKVKLHSKTFEKMENLRMLHFFNSHVPWSESNVFLASSLKSLPDGLKILCWDGFPQRSLPQNYWPQNLVRLEMIRCHLEQLWEPDQKLPNLKWLDLRYSGKLIRIPDLYLSPDIEGILLTGCSKFEIFPEIKDTMENLAVLKLDGTAIKTLPSSLCRLVALEVLSLDSCASLETIPSSIGDLSKLCKLGLTYCESLETFPSSIFKLKLTKLDLSRCSKLRTFPEILEPAQTFAHVNLTGTAIKELPFSFGNLVHLQTLRLNMCTNLESLPNSIFKLKLTKLDLSRCSKLRTFPEILEPAQTFAHVNLTGTAIKELPFSFGNLVHLQTLRLNMCTDLESLPNSIVKLKLTELDLSGCSKLRTFPEILEPAQTFAHVYLTGTAIKELPFSFGNLVQLQTLHLNLCTDLESLPNSIVNLNLLSVLDCSGCAKLTEIPSDIGCLSLLRELSLGESRIVNLPESICNLSSLELLDLSECKKLECIPRLPAFLKQLLAFDCQSITTVMPLSNSLIQIPSNSQECNIFRFCFTNGQQLDPGARANIMDESRLRMTEDAYRSVFFCFPGSEVPHWLPFRCEGHSITIHRDSLDFCRNDRLIGFALCVVFQLPDTNDIKRKCGSFSYCLNYVSDHGKHILPNNDNLKSYFYWRDQERKLDQDQDHTFLWKYNLEFPEMSCMSRMLPRARSFTFEISPYYDDNILQPPSFLSIDRYFKSTVKVKKCGICPLYTKKKDDNNAGAGDYSGSVRFSKNGIEEPSGSNAA